MKEFVQPVQPGAITKIAVIEKDGQNPGKHRNTLLSS